MNRFYLLLILILNLQVAKADWDLFPLSQKSYVQYLYNSWPPQQKINLISFDTIVQRSGWQSAFMNRRYSGNGIEQCYSTLTDVNQGYLPGGSWMETEMDSLIMVGDTTRYSSRLYFLPKSNPVESWRISGSLSNGFTDIEFTCTSISVQSFLGLSDSVKEFTLATYNGVNLFSSSLSGYVIRLSKNYGLINYAGFRELESHGLEPHLLVGIDHSSGTFGFSPPTYLDFFPYHVGDVLNWKYERHSFWYPVFLYYHQDSILSVNVTSDTLSYTCISRTYFPDQNSYTIDTNSVYFLVNNFKSKMECPANWMTLSDVNGGWYPQVFFKSGLIVEQDSSITVRIIDDGHQVYDTITCYIGQAPDAGGHDLFNTKQGHIENCYDAFDYNCSVLIGSFINGVLYGDTVLVTGIENITSKNIKGIYPNPAQDKISFELYRSGGSLIIISSQGDICKSLNIHELKTEINISDLSPGLYFLKYIDANGGQSVKKIICTR